VAIIDGGSRRHAHDAKSPRWRKWGGISGPSQQFPFRGTISNDAAAVPPASVDAAGVFVIQSRSPFCARQP
jgi:hypothetical protein